MKEVSWWSLCSPAHNALLWVTWWGFLTPVPQKIERLAVSLEIEKCFAISDGEFSGGMGFSLSIFVRTVLLSISPKLQQKYQGF